MKLALHAIPVFFAIALLGTAALADEPARVEGRNCTVDDRGTEIWFGYFKGQRDVFAPLKGGDKAKTFTSWRCFKAEAECNSWKYWMEADFPNGRPETFCKQGG